MLRAKINQLEKAESLATRLVRGSCRVSYEGRLRQLNSTSLEHRHLQADLVLASKIFKGEVRPSDFFVRPPRTGLSKEHLQITVKTQPFQPLDPHLCSRKMKRQVRQNNACIYNFEILASSASHVPTAKLSGRNLIYSQHEAAWEGWLIIMKDCLNWMVEWRKGKFLIRHIIASHQCFQAAPGQRRFVGHFRNTRALVKKLHTTK